MTIQTKYNIGDEVYMIWENKARLLKIRKIHSYVYNEKKKLKTCVSYQFEDEDFMRIDEYKLASTKEELIEML